MIKRDYTDKLHSDLLCRVNKVKKDVGSRYIITRFIPPAEATELPTEQKTCFVVSPIGREGSEERRRADQVLRHIIEPSALECGYKAIRADRISEPGLITPQVIQHLVEDPLVIADLTGRNPNVFYELAIRHAVKKPIVQIIQAGEAIPFDVAQSRTIQVDHHDLDSTVNCKQELANQIRIAEKDSSAADNPISVAIDLLSPLKSGSPVEKRMAEMISMLQDVRVAVGTIAGGVRSSVSFTRLREVRFTLERVAGVLPSEEDVRDNERVRDKLREAKGLLERARALINILSHDRIYTSSVSPIDRRLVEEVIQQLERDAPQKSSEE